MPALKGREAVRAADLEQTYTFVLLLQGGNPLEHLDALFEAGCDDAVFGRRNGVYFAEFDREAADFPEAVETAIQQVERAVLALSVVRVEPDELVNASAIAERMGRTRESIRLLVEHRRGPGDFPPPVTWVASKHPLWRWSLVAQWFADRLGESTETTTRSAFLAACNAALEVRNYTPRLSQPKEREVVRRIVAETPGIGGSRRR